MTTKTVQSQSSVGGGTSRLRGLQWAGVAVGTMVMILVLVSGGAKILDVPEFRDRLRTWTVFPGVILNVVAIVIPLMEISIGAAWFLAFGRRRILGIWAVCLVLYTAAILTQSTLAQPPDCGCIALLDEYFSSRKALPWMLCRNLVLLVTTVGCWAVLRDGGTRRPPADSH